MRCSTLVLWLCCAATISQTGCASHDDGKPTSQNSPPPPPSMPAGMSDDDAVLNVVLADLLTLDKSPLAMRDKPPTEILLSPERFTPSKVDNLLLKHDKPAWDALSDAELAAATEAAAALVRRGESGENLKPFVPIDPRVKLDVGPAPADRSPFDRPVGMSNPGFTADGKYAIVALGIPWSIHHADATYLLVRDGASWRVLLRQFVYYV